MSNSNSSNKVSVPEAKEAMNRFGSDKPDLRFGMELTDVSDVVKDCEFVVFKSALEMGGSVRGINAKGQGKLTNWLNLQKDTVQKVLLISQFMKTAL